MIELICTNFVSFFFFFWGGGGGGGGEEYVPHRMQICEAK